MLVPEASVHEQRQPVPRQDNVGAAGQILPMQAETQSLCVQQAPHDQLRPRFR